MQNATHTDRCQTGEKCIEEALIIDEDVDVKAEELTLNIDQTRSELSALAILEREEETAVLMHGHDIEGHNEIVSRVKSTYHRICYNDGLIFYIDPAIAQAEREAITKFLRELGQGLFEKWIDEINALLPTNYLKLSKDMVSKIPVFIHSEETTKHFYPEHTSRTLQDDCATQNLRTAGVLCQSIKDDNKKWINLFYADDPNILQKLPLNLIHEVVHLCEPKNLPSGPIFNIFREGTANMIANKISDVDSHATLIANLMLSPRPSKQKHPLWEAISSYQKEFKADLEKIFTYEVWLPLEGWERYGRTISLYSFMTSFILWYTQYVDPQLQILSQENSRELKSALWGTYPIYAIGWPVNDLLDSPFSTASGHKAMANMIHELKFLWSPIYDIVLPKETPEMAQMAKEIKEIAATDKNKETKRNLMEPIVRALYQSAREQLLNIQESYNSFMTDLVREFESLPPDQQSNYEEAS